MSGPFLVDLVLSGRRSERMTPITVEGMGFGENRSVGYRD
ncbi:hypothetical protein AS9A_4307 [Hoyosella subflava DQS3-9A1]|uniref:Uncharacterized protein n=1 Tax=Hoyosella subflava (strain DSM 45089 / JCM 17490 / NBRC 109087 / DQS3-9A1) TaxID=443218 RepID=F6ELV9_HOYSD|nr:hypothetical protein AS9A_4307 [Hoyosella subflava DQS3-9A1]